MGHPPPPTHTIVARDGWNLHVRDLGATHTGGAIIVAGHAMMVDGRTMARVDRPCLARALADRGHRVLVPDLRGHGRSGPRPDAGGDWTYDDLVADVGEYVALARKLAPGQPLVLLGHSLFGHNALAHVGLRPQLPVAAMVLLAADVWQRGHEPSAVHWAAKVAMLATSTITTRLVGYMPARRLGLGSNDEAAAYWGSFWPLVRNGWRADDGTSYQAAIKRIRCPVLHVVSHGDRLYARRASALAMTAQVPNREVLSLGDTGATGAAALSPDHMELVIDPANAPVWSRIIDWIDTRVLAAS